MIYLGDLDIVKRFTLARSYRSQRFLVHSRHAIGNAISAIIYLLRSISTIETTIKMHRLSHTIRYSLHRSDHRALNWIVNQKMYTPHGLLDGNRQLMAVLNITLVFIGIDRG